MATSLEATALTAQLTAGRTYLAGYDAPWIDDERARLDLLHHAALAAYSSKPASALAAPSCQAPNEQHDRLSRVPRCLRPVTDS